MLIRLKIKLDIQTLAYVSTFREHFKRLIGTVYYKSQWFKNSNVFNNFILFFSIDLYNQRIKPCNKSGKNWPVHVYAGLLTLT